MPKKTDPHTWARAAVAEMLRRCTLTLAAKLEREAMALRAAAQRGK